ncbi:MAG: NUDIX domain-containing protein [Patescibacteria group bacterium]
MKQTNLIVQAIIEHRGKVLVGKRLKTSKHMIFSSWQIPGGHLEPDETFDQAVKREIGEETGLRIRLIKSFPYFFNRPSKAGDQVLLLYYARVVGRRLLKSSQEYGEFAWIIKKDLKNMEFTIGTKRALTYWFKLRNR